MSMTPTQIRIDADVKEQASALFHELGMDMSGAVNIFLRQCLMHDGLPFPVERPHPKDGKKALDREDCNVEC